MKRRAQQLSIPAGQKWAGILFFFVLFSMFCIGMPSAAQTRVVIALAPHAASPEKIAAEELASHLRMLYPSTQFDLGAASAAVPTIYLGTPQELPGQLAALAAGKLKGPDSYVVASDPRGTAREAMIAGATPRSTLFAVDALLEKLGFGFYLSYNTAPTPSRAAFSFAGWAINDTPVASERIVFEWHNFLSGCSTWNLDDWQKWIMQSSRMRFNTIMVHAYGNNPMYAFSMNGETKPTGYLANTEFGRDWGTEHVVDVRNIVGADGLFNGPVFGADASLVPDDQKVAAAEGLMQKVFQFAAQRGMGVTFALDVDTEAANPQNVIKTLPASARFEHGGLELVDPDTPEGYAYYRTEVDQLMKVYPEITQLAVWFRGGLNSPWRELRPEEFPTAWRAEYQAGMSANPRLKNDPEAPSLFAISKIAKAFRKALNETGHSNVTMAAGSWRFTYLPSADVFMPKDVTLMPLDYDRDFPSDPVQESLRSIARHRPMVPIVWAQHDDREYAGRSYTPFEGFASLLRWSNSAGYGIIHWTTRPLDLYFKNIADQVWTSSENEPLNEAARAMALRTFGPRAGELGGRYLNAWINDAPAFGRETSDRFIDQIIDPENEEVGAKGRLAMLNEMRPLVESAAARDWVDYYADWEHYAEGFFQSQGAVQRSQAALGAGDVELARREIQSADADRVIEQYAKTIQHGEVSRGEKGILITLNLRWLPHVEAQRQAVGLDPLEVEFAPTHDEPLAQGEGHFTFDFDSSKKVVAVLGSAALGVDVQQFPAGAECASGIEVGSPVSLSIGGLAGARLEPGTYRMKLRMPEGAQIQVETGSDHQTATPSTELELQTSDGKVHFTLSPVAGSARVCGLALSLQPQAH